MNPILQLPNKFCSLSVLNNLFKIFFDKIFYHLQIIASKFDLLLKSCKATDKHTSQNDNASLYIYTIRYRIHFNLIFFYKLYTFIDIKFFTIEALDWSLYVNKLATRKKNTGLLIAT